jgi:hypothetical protein
VTKAGKGNMLVIMREDDYNNKIVNFINNNFTKLPQDITTKQQQAI